MDGEAKRRQLLTSPCHSLLRKEGRGSCGRAGKEEEEFAFPSPFSGWGSRMDPTWVLRNNLIPRLAVGYHETGRGGGKFGFSLPSSESLRIFRFAQ